MKEGRRRVGCVALTGMVLVGAAALLGVIGMGAKSGVLRSDPAGLLLLAALLGLLGLGVFIAASRGGK